MAVYCSVMLPFPSFTAVIFQAIGSLRDRPTGHAMTIYIAPLADSTVKVLGSAIFEPLRLFKKKRSYDVTAISSVVLQKYLFFSASRAQFETIK